ncbi:MAG: hypothetical protein KGJ13_08655 [Patescibacteria group bacterium]|nr:hypothetical protein [Patescibacteria group bacterium]
MAAPDYAALAAKYCGVSSPTGIDSASLASKYGGTSTPPTANGAAPSNALQQNPDGTIPNPFGTSTVPDPAFSAAQSLQQNPDGTIPNPFTSGGSGNTPPPQDKGFMGNVFGNGQGSWWEDLLKNSIGSNGVAGLLGRPISSAMTAGAETGVANSKSQLGNVTQALIKKIQTLPQGDPTRASLTQIVKENQKAMGISDETMNALESNQETQEQSLAIAANAAATLATGATGAPFYSPLLDSLFGIGSKAAGIGAKIGANAIIAGLSGVGSAAANNESPEAVLAQGAFGAATGAILTGPTEVGYKILKSIPVRLYSQFFKTTTDEFEQGMTSDAAKMLQKTDPTTFQQLVDKGIIKLNADGTVQVSKSAAQRALEAGIAGSPKRMGAQIAAGAMKLENQVQNVASKADPVEIGTWQRNSTINLLQSFRDRIAKSGGGVFANAMTDPLDATIKILQGSDGTIPATDALQIRRMLDAMQKAKAYDPEANLTISDSVLKNATNYFRRVVNGIPGMGDLMRQYSNYMDMMTDIVKRGASLTNAKAFNVFDLMAITEGAKLGEGELGGLGLGLKLEIIARALTSATGGTFVAQGINNLSNVGSSEAVRSGLERAGSLFGPKLEGNGNQNP